MRKEKKIKFLVHLTYIKIHIFYILNLLILKNHKICNNYRLSAKYDLYFLTNKLKELICLKHIGIVFHRTGAYTFKLFFRTFNLPY